MTAATCAWCSAYSTMMSQGEPLIVERDEETRETLFQKCFSCSHCRKLSIGALWSEPGTSDVVGMSAAYWSQKEDRIRWTPESIGGKAFPDVPAHIASAADEVFRCSSIKAYRAAILLARGVVEATAKDKGVGSGQLFQKIEEMHSKAIIRSFTRDAAHELRFLGNDMAHGDFVGNIQSDDCTAVLDVMVEILNEVYQGPARVARMQTKRRGAIPAT